jgi:hypothetical protein
MCVPVFGGGDGIPRSVGKIGEGDVPNMCDGIGEGGASSVSIPKMCDGGTRQKEPMKLGAGGGDRSPERVLNIGHSRLRVDHLGQLYVLDSEDEGIGMEAGLYVPDSEEEDGHGHAVSVDSFVDVLGCPKVMLVGATTVDVQWELQPWTYNLSGWNPSSTRPFSASLKVICLHASNRSDMCIFVTMRCCFWVDLLVMCISVMMK